jgi:hypothetical protein
MMDTRTEYVMFGDSFVKMFGLIRHSKLQTIGYKGASAKGLGRHGTGNSSNNKSASTITSSSRSRSLSNLSRSNSNNSNNNTSNNAAGADIQYRLQRMTSLKGCYFNFGQVDVHLSYYYKTYGQREDIDLDDIARRYVDFVANLQILASTSNNRSHDVRNLDRRNSGGDNNDANQQKKKTIVGVYPSAPDDDYVRQALVAYGSLSEEQSQGIPNIDVLLQTRQDRVMRFNQILQECCIEKEINFVDCFDDLCSRSENDSDNSNVTTTTATTPGGTVVISGTATGVATGCTASTGIPRLRDEFRDISKCNIHLVWETTLLLWMRRLPWLSTLAPPGFEQQLQETFAKYADTKPWADKSHGSNVCQHLLKGMSISESSAADAAAATSASAAAAPAAAAVP